MTTFLAAAFLVLLAVFGLLCFLALGSLFLLSLTVALAAQCFLPSLWANYVTVAAILAQGAWLGFVLVAQRRYDRRFKADPTFQPSPGTSLLLVAVGSTKETL